MTTFIGKNMEVLVFKTNLRYKKDLKNIAHSITDEPRIKTWNVDIQDIDKVLRVESTAIAADEIIEMVEHAGYYCAELTD